jgi:hypothetical protein
MPLLQAEQQQLEILEMPARSRQQLMLAQLWMQMPEQSGMGRRQGWHR